MPSATARSGRSSQHGHIGTVAVSLLAMGRSGNGDRHGGADGVGDERVVPGRGQLGLLAEVANPAHDAPVAAGAGPGDLRDPSPV
jgi:hypothetical protein